MFLESWKRIKKHKPSLVSFAILLIFTLMAVAAPLIAQFSYFEQNAEHALQFPNQTYWFGTDSLGRDLFSRILYGARISLSVGFFTAVFSLFIGIIYGSIAGYVGGRVDSFLMRVADILNALPSLLVTVLLMLVVGRGPLGIFLALGFVGWVGEARLVRGQVLQMKEMLFVEAARSLGLKPFRILFQHILPNILGPVIVSLTFGIPQNIMAESFLSFVGLGLEPPYASWGTLANEGWRAYRTYPYLIFFPGIVLFITILAFNFLGDGLRDALDPQSSKRV
ncbi:MAG: ABC transporter permease [Oligoflexia bacterium]|nr:ABC transporter permease [Oligoflexia bacterium]